MARLIPNDRIQTEFSGSYGEMELYDLFRNLSDNYVIFHSAEWTKRRKHNFQFGEADFLIYHQEYGIICLEVKHGGIKCIDNRIYQINSRTNEIVAQIDPMNQAKNSSFKFHHLIRDKVENKNLQVKVYPAVWFTMIHEDDLIGELPQVYKKGNTFFRNHMEDLDKTLINCFNYYNVKKRTADRKINKIVMNVLAPEFKAFPSLSSLYEYNEMAFNQMTREQSYLLDYLEEQKEAAIQGGAGTGKTMLAIEKASRLAERDRVLFLCFNTLLIDYMRSAYSKDMPNVAFTNLDRMLVRKLKRLPTEEETEFYMQNFEDYPELWDYDHIIIDEGQDFTDNQIRFLKEIALLKEGCFYVFYDRNQLVQQRSELKWLKEMDCQLVLSFNCRNTKEIAETSCAPINIDNVKVRYELTTQDKPTYRNVVNEEELLEWLAKRIDYYKREKVPLNQLVILTVKTLDKSMLQNITEISGIKLTNTKDDNGILFTTSRKFKGLEANVIFLIDVDIATFSTMENRRVFYVGASRAKSGLEIISTVSSDYLKDFYSIVSNGEKHRISSVMEHLKVKPV